MRTRRKDKHLPPCVYHRHGAYYYVKEGKWIPLGEALPSALAKYAQLIEPRTGGCDELLDRMLERCRERIDAEKDSLSKATVDQYTIVWKKLKPILAEFTPDMVEPHHVATILDHHRNTPNIANRMLTFLRMAFAHGLTWGMCRTNPCYGVKRHKEHSRKRLISMAEYEAIKASGSTSLRAIMDIAYLTGQRIGDVLAIRLADITKDGIYFEQPKTGKRLMVTMTTELEQAIANAKALHSNVRGLTLFHGRGGKPLSYYGVRSAFERAAEKAKIENVTLHDIRAMAATAAKKQGLSATALMGHTTESTTVRYLRDRDYQVVNGPSIGQVLDNWTKDAKKSTR
jgi:integrase